jgi:hypothetical protein
MTHGNLQDTFLTYHSLKGDSKIEEAPEDRASPNLKYHKWNSFKILLKKEKMFPRTTT